MDKINKAVGVVFEAYKKHLETRLRILDEIVDAQILEFQKIGMKFTECLDLSIKALDPDKDKMVMHATEYAFDEIGKSIDIFRNPLAGEKFTDEEREQVTKEVINLVSGFRSRFMHQRLEERIAYLRQRFEQG